MSSEDRRIWLYQEEARLTKYQHQHRGLSFEKFLLPPIADRKVNLLGLDNHIYKGRVPKIPEDQLPPEVDKESIDEEALYKEIRDMSFPVVPEQEPLGPCRRIGGEYTLSKNLVLVPVQVDCTKGMEETIVLGRDGGIYRGKEKVPSRIELNKQLRGTKRTVQKVKRTSSDRGFVEPSLVLLHTTDKPLQHEKNKKTLELPASEVGKVLELIMWKRIKERFQRIKLGNEDESNKTDQTEIQSEIDEEPEQLNHTEERDKANTEELNDTDKVEATEADSESSPESDTDIPVVDTDAEIPDTEIPVEADAEIPNESYRESQAEIEESLITEEIKEPTEESDPE